jgi:hypothetical protein
MMFLSNLWIPDPMYRARRNRPPGQESCRAPSPPVISGRSYICNRTAGHSRRHAASTGKWIVATWSEAD